MVLRDVAFLFKKSLKASLNIKDWETRSTLTQNRIPSNHGCCAASVASEQQHKQDLKRIYRRGYEFSNSSLSTRMHCI